MTKLKLSQRQNPDRLHELRELSEESDISQVALIAAAIKALYKTWKERGELVIPFRIVPEKDLIEFQRLQSK